MFFLVTCMNNKNEKKKKKKTKKRLKKVETCRIPTGLCRRVSLTRKKKKKKKTRPKNDQISYFLSFHRRRWIAGRYHGSSWDIEDEKTGNHRLPFRFHLAPLHVDPGPRSNRESGSQREPPGQARAQSQIEQLPEEHGSEIDERAEFEHRVQQSQVEGCNPVARG